MNICVYGAASNSISADYLSGGERLGAAIAAHGHAVVFGGGGNGMMGAVARGARRAGGDVIGVAPTFFPDGVLFSDCTAFHATETMRERKALMEKLADGFLVTAGGIGTLEEFFEIYTLRHLGRHEKKIAIFNDGGCFDPLVALLRHTVKEGFLPEEDLSLLFVSDDAEEILAYFEK